MANTYVLVYKGGKMPEGEAAQAQVMEAWGKWYAGLGDAVVDGGNPFGPSRSVSRDGSVADGAPSALSGYTILKAEDMDTACTWAKDCPVLEGGASVEVYETFDAMAGR